MSALLTQITQGKKRLTRPLIRLITSLSLVLFSFYCQTLQAQVISNAGAAMSISSGTVLNAVDIENTSGTITNSGTVTLTGNHSNAGTSAGDGTYNISGNWTNTGTFTAGSSTVNFNGGNAQSIGGSAATTFHNLTIANTNGGINLTNPESVDGSLSLSSGVLSTSATNILSLTNTSSAAITTASGTSYVSGPMKWSLASGSSYIFPLGKGSSSSTYFPFNLNTVSGTSPVVQVEAFASAPTGTADGTSLSALSSSEYWLLTMISGTFSGATVDLNRQTAVSPLDNIGRSTNDASLSYSALGGSGSGNAINGSNDIGSIASSGTNYFVMGQRSKIYNISTNNAFTGANTYCKNDGSPTNLSATFNTCTTGNGTPLATTVTVSWYYNTTNSTTIAGATQLAQTTGASTGTSGTVAFTYSPSTGTAGTFYYFAVLSAPSSNVCGFVTSLSTGTQLVTVAATPLAPTLGGASPTNGSTICQGYNSGAVTGIAGSGGSSGAADEYQLSINGGSSYASYTNGTAINTATASGSVIVQARRTGGSLACTTTSWTTLSTWTIGTSVVSPALNVASPASGTSICAGYNGPSATITAGSGGSSGTADLYEYSIDNGGSWATYTAGTAINTAGALSDVMIRVSRSAGSYGCSGSGTTTIATWPISTSPVGPALSTASPADGTTLCAGFNTGTVSGAAGSGGSSGAADAYRYSLDGGTSWASYTNGATINTSAATGNILVQSMRTSGSFGCSNTSWTTICSWTLGSPTQNPVLNVASPAGGTTICAGYTGPGATITPGSGGSTGASDLYEYSLDNGSNWLTYTPANQINTTGATSNVLIRVSRSGGSYGCNASGPTTIVTWPVSSSTTYPALNTATPPNGRAICAGYSGVNATITAGSGGSAGAADEYEISTAGALGTFNTYASGASINTSGATDTIIVRARRTGGNFGCTGSSWSTISYWPIGSASSLPTLTTPTPSNGTTVCIGNSSPNATIHAGSGGSYSAADLNEFSIDNGGNWSAYTSGNTISLTGASVNVLIRVRRSGGSYGCSDIGPSTIVTWPVAPTPAAPTGSAAQSVCTGSTLADLTASGTAIQWYTASSGGLLLPGSTVITNGSTYYASQTQSFCESISRLLVTASLYPSGRWIGVVSTDWSEPNNWCGGVPTSSTDALIPSGVSHYPTVDITTAICRDITINSGATLTIAEAKALHVTGVLTNSNGNSGLKLNSSSAGTGSLLHSTNNVPATVDRYISGSAEDWHFLSSPVAAQVISTGTGPGTWTPSGTYGNGTGYDLYTWDEAASCWVFQLNTNLGITPNWPTYHPESYFKPGCGYLYSLQLAAQTKTFTGNLNNDLFNIPLTFGGPNATYKGFNLVGNPYPSSIDWYAGSGWTRTALSITAGGNDAWIWNSSANNYGVYNSADAGGVGSNYVTRYIAPMQAFFVKAGSAGILGMDNSVRSSTGASNWLKGTAGEALKFKLVVNSLSGKGFDEVILNFGADSNEAGAPKLFSYVASAPSLYLPYDGENLSVLHLTNCLKNPRVPVMFKPGNNGEFTITANFNPADFENVYLEDRKYNYFQKLNQSAQYRFKGENSDDVSRFVLHFSTISNPASNEIPAGIYANSDGIVIDLSLVSEDTELFIYDVLGRILHEEKLKGNMEHQLYLQLQPQVLVISLKNSHGGLEKKFVFRPR